MSSCCRCSYFILFSLLKMFSKFRLYVFLFTEEEVEGVTADVEEALAVCGLSVVTWLN